MISLFSAAGLNRLDAIVQPGVLCAFDFDGTLAPIVDQPSQARMAPDLQPRLVALSRYAPVAIISGRAVPDVQERLGFEADFVLGNHGNEGLPGWEQQAAVHAALCVEWERQLRSALPQSLSDTGLQIENKRYSLSVHYRLTPQPEQARQQLTELLARLTPPPRIIPGKYVFNLLPADGYGKGHALEELMQRSLACSALYVGDDVTDEDVFQRQRRDLLSIRIEFATHSAAEFFLPARQDMARLLDALNTRLGAFQTTNWLRSDACFRA